MKYKPGLVVLGASGHAQVIVDTLTFQNKYSIKGFLDHQFEVGSIVANHPVLGDDDLLKSLIQQDPGLHIIIGIGDNAVREKISLRVSQQFPDIQWGKAIHPSATIGMDVETGAGTVVMAGAIINTGTKIGNHCIVNTSASIDHHNRLEDFSSVAPGVTTGGNVTIGAGSAVSIGAIVKHATSIGNDTIIGAGSLVLQNIPDEVVAFGTPAKVIRTRKKGDRYL